MTEKKSKDSVKDAGIRELDQKISKLEGRKINSEEAARLIDECVKLATDLSGD